MLVISFVHQVLCSSRHTHNSNEKDSGTFGVSTSVGEVLLEDVQSVTVAPVLGVAQFKAAGAALGAASLLYAVAVARVPGAGGDIADSICLQCDVILICMRSFFVVFNLLRCVSLFSAPWGSSRLCFLDFPFSDEEFSTAFLPLFLSFATLMAMLVPLFVPSFFSLAFPARPKLFFK